MCINECHENTLTWSDADGFKTYCATAFIKDNAGYRASK